MEQSSFEVESCVRGHHVYQSVWNPQLGQMLLCERELGNPKDPYAIAVLTGPYKKLSVIFPGKYRLLVLCFFEKEDKSHVLLQLEDAIQPICHKEVWRYLAL